jgi:hypothetical protein
LGPGKCGSSSIQSFFRENKGACTKKVKYLDIHPDHIAAFNQEDLDEPYFKNYCKRLEKAASRCHALIISHEYFFQCPLAISKFVNYFQAKVADIRIIGYCRRQSDFFISAYSQWLFRSSERILEVKQSLTENQIEFQHFTGLEQFLIASILNDFHSARQLSGRPIYRWDEGYAAIASVTPKAKTICGILPNKLSPLNLIEDFCSKAGLMLKESFKSKSAITKNKSFSPLIIEAIFQSISAGNYQMSSHHSNEELIYISKYVKAEANALKDFIFIEPLKNYIDSYFLETNLRFAEDFNLDKGYFQTDQMIAKGEILNHIKKEVKSRADKIQIRKLKLISILSEALIQMSAEKVEKRELVNYFLA